MTIQQVQSQRRALKRYKRRIERIQLSPTDAIDAAEVADKLEWRILARWSVCFSAFLKQVRG